MLSKRLYNRPPLLDQKIIAQIKAQNHKICKKINCKLIETCKNMDVIKPETYWIGNRCFRKNPSKNSTGLGLKNNQIPYVEDDDMISCDPDAPDESEDQYLIETIDNGFRTKCDSIPPSLYPHIIGSKGSTKKRIEYDTNTRINVPRPNEKGSIIIRGQKVKDVENARRRLELIASQSRIKRDATHFACFPLNYPDVVQKIQEFKDEVMKECMLNSRGVTELVFNKPEKLHLTLCVMVLLDEQERKAATGILKTLEDEIKREITHGAKIRVQLKGLEIMNDDPTEVDILYAKVISESGNDLLQRVADLTALRFIESGFAKNNRGEQVKLHCTLMNTRLKAESQAAESPDNDRGNSSTNGRKDQHCSYQRESFDASLILSKFKDFDFGVVEIQEIKLATRHTSGSDGFYKAYSSIPL